MPTAGFISFRLGGRDGVAGEAAKWARVFARIGWRTTSIAGDGPVDRRLPGLAMHAPAPPTITEVEGALAECDLVIVENLCSLPLNPPAARVVAEALQNRPAILHHHDLPWQRPAFDGPPFRDFVPTGASWQHVVINDLSRKQLAEHGIHATVIRNAFDVEPPPGDRAATRAALGVADGERLALLPSRALPRKNIPEAVALCNALGATFWLLGPAEDGYEAELDRVLTGATGRVIAGPSGTGADDAVADAYAACDLVVFPSTWEGFGNPTVESAVHRRPLAIGAYPVATELRRFGFRWFPTADPAPMARFLDNRASPDGRVTELLEHNHNVARRFFSMDRLTDDLCQLIERSFWKAGLA